MGISFKFLQCRMGHYHAPLLNLANLGVNNNLKNQKDMFKQNDANFKLLFVDTEIMSEMKISSFYSVFFIHMATFDFTEISFWLSASNCSSARSVFLFDICATNL